VHGARSRRGPRAHRCAERLGAPGDTSDLRVLGVGLKLVGIQDIGDRERLLFDAFAVDERESAELVERVVADAASGLEGIQFITDQGTPYVAEAAKQAYDAIGVEHAPQREGTPTENGVAERWIGSVRRELLDHVVVVNDRHLLRLLRDYVAYHDDRTHLSLAKATPAGRPRKTRPVGDAEVIALPRLGGLHHRYEWRAAA
jgi:putative transposase